MKGAVWLLVAAGGAAVCLLCLAHKEGPGRSVVRTDPGAGPVPVAPRAVPGEPPSTEARLREVLDREGVESFLRELRGMDWGALHEKFGEGPGAALAIVRDDVAVAKIFPERVATPPVRGPDLGETPWKDGMTLEFPDGAFDFPWPKDGPCPGGLVVKGAGMDRTLLRLRSGSLRSDEIRDFRMLDLTVECLRGYFGADRVTMRMDRCRVVFGDPMVRARGELAFRAQGCRFEGGEVFEGDGVARFDDCVLWGDRDVIRGHVACLFRSCKFMHAEPKLKDRMEKRPGVRLEECVLDPNPFSGQKLWTINPTWKD